MCILVQVLRLYGKVKIGNNVRIGANCVVTKDIPDNSTVVSAENRVIRHDTYRDNHFYKYKKGE